MLIYITPYRRGQSDLLAELSLLPQAGIISGGAAPTFAATSRTLICQCILLATVACEMQLG